MAVRITNPSGSPIGLPEPFQGVLQPGARTSFPGTSREVINALGGAVFRGGLQVTVIPDQVQYDNPFYRGKFGVGTQATWVVDPVGGNDKGLGTAADPLKTVIELGTRLSGVKFEQDTIVTLLGDMPPSDALKIIGGQIDADFRFTLEGTITVVASGSIVAVVGNADTSRAPWEIETTGLDWTTTPERRIELPGGIIGWVGEVVDADNVRVSTFQGEDDDDDVTPVALDTFTVGRPSTLENVVLQIVPSVLNPIVFLDEDSTLPMHIRKLDINGGDRISFFIGVKLFGMIMRNQRTFSAGDSMYRACFRDTTFGQEFAVRDDAGGVFLWDGGLISDPDLLFNSWIPGSPTTFMRGTPWVYRTGIFLNTPGYFQTRTRVHIERWPFEAINFFTTSGGQLNKEISGSSVEPGSVGIAVAEGLFVKYLGAANKPSVSGAAGDTRIGGTILDYLTSIPVVDLTTLAALKD